MPDVVDWFRQLPTPVVPALAASLLVAESALLAGVVLPGASAVLALGVLARVGFVPPAAAVLAAALGAITGQQIAYLRGAPSVPARLRGLARRAERALRDGGLPAVCAAQWVVGMRTVAPRLASTAGVPYRRFAPASAANATVWATALTGLAYAAEAVREWVGPSLAGAGAAVVAVVVVRRRARRA